MSSTTGEGGRSLSEALFASFEHALVREIATATLRRAVISCVLLVVVSSILIFSQGNRDPTVLYFIGGFVLLQCAALWMFRKRVRDSVAMVLIAALGILCIGWLALLAWFGIADLNELALISLIVTIGFAGTAWRPAIALLWCIVSWVWAGALLCYHFDAEILVIGLWAVVLFFLPLMAMRFSHENRLSLLTRVAQTFLGHYCESVSSSALSTMHLLTYQLRILMGARIAMVLTTTGQREVITLESVNRESIDPVYARTLVQKLKDRGTDQGIFLRKEFGEDFDARFIEWFGYRPRMLFLFKLMMVREERETEVIVAIPPARTERMYGSKRLFSLGLGLVSLARLSLSAARSRFIASDSLLITQRSVSEREEELNELVHLVNNVAQDIAMRCDDLRQGVEAVSQSEAHDALKSKLKGDVRELEAASRNLSTGVSDKRVIKELVRMKKFTRKEKIALHPVMEDLSLFGLYHAKRRTLLFRIQSELDPSMGVEVISREFLESCLRQLFRDLFERCSPGTEVRLRVKAVNQKCEFDFSIIEGPEASLSSKVRFTDFKTLPAFEAFNHFVSLSGGEIGPQSASPGAQATLRCSLVAATLSSRNPVTKGRWALFVDDNAQVTEFYGRVAQALNLPFSAAGSVVEALRLLDQEGQPRLIITDLQLGDQSGLEIVREARKRFGPELPVIVVSGNLSEEVKLQVAKVGATNFLAKPVGRARLFAEIQSILEVKPRR